MNLRAIKNSQKISILGKKLTMNKALIGALVGGFIIWFWQFLSWSFLQVHTAEFQYTDAQDSILSCLADAGLEDGTYYMPNLPKTASSEEHAALMEESMGKPWAHITYRNASETNMGLNMFRGFVVDVLAVFFLCYILIGRNDLTMQKVVICSIMVGLIGYFTISYLNTIWFGTSSIGYLIDAIVQWGACGLWLGFWLRRGE